MTRHSAGVAMLGVTAKSIQGLHHGAYLLIRPFHDGRTVTGAEDIELERSHQVDRSESLVHVFSERSGRRAEAPAVVNGVTADQQLLRWKQTFPDMI